MVSWQGRYITPGIKVGEYGLYGVKDEQFPLLQPYDEGEMHKFGTIFTPQDPSEGEALEHGREYYLRFVLSPYGEAEEVHHRLKVTRQGLPLLIYYPVWIVRYLSGRKIYRLTLDAVTGNAVYLDRPRKKSRSYHVLALLGTMLLAFLLTTPSSAYLEPRAAGSPGEVFALLVLPMFGAGVLFMLWLEQFIWKRFAERVVEKVTGGLTGRQF